MKTTKATLKALAKKGLLTHTITSEFNGMTDGVDEVKRTTVETTLHHIERFWVSKNYLEREGNTIKLTNCCFRITFKIKE